MERFDLAVIGAGAAGMFCAGIAGQRGLKVLLLDHAPRLGEKIRISGGGRCNFTNLNGADPARYLSQDPRFARHALQAYPPQRFVELVRSHRIAFHEKHLGQLFCDDASQRIIDLLLAECGARRVAIRHPVRVAVIERQPDAQAPLHHRTRTRADRCRQPGDCHRRPFHSRHRRHRFRVAPAGRMGARCGRRPAPGWCR